MKTKITILIGVLLSVCVSKTGFAQADNAGPTGHQRAAGQYLGWDATGVAGTLDIRNDFNNQPIDFFSNGIQRMRIAAGNATAPTTGTPTAGFVGIGPHPSLYSRLTISNIATGAVGGYRPWMQTGVFSHQGTDAMYVGLRQMGDVGNRFDATIAWSDDPTDNLGIDKLRFVFTSPPIGGTGTNPRSTESINGYEYMLMTPFPDIVNSTNLPIGHIGIGPMFDDNNLPQNRLHLNAEDNLQTFLQITNELGTGQTATDGLHIGYTATSTNNLETQINQRENDRLSLFSNNGERIRIMHTGALNNGVTFNPGGLATNLTRIGISHNPATPVTRPLSLLHLGYDVANPSSNDGWRSWMDVGMFVSQNSDNVYLGLDTASNGADAVLSWGDNPINDGSGSGPDNFKMVFTAPLLSNPLYPASAQSGVEGLRMTPSLQGINTGIGGDAANGNPYHGSSTNPTATLEVNAWGNTNGNSGLRFTDLNSTAVPTANQGDGVLSVDSIGNVVYVEANNAPNIGNYCGSTPSPLTGNFEVPLNNNNYYFTGQGTNPDSNFIGSSVGIGLNCGDPIPLAKLHVLQSASNPNEDSTSAAGIFENDATGSVTVGVFGTS